MTPAHLGGSYKEGDGNTTMRDVWGYLIVKYELKSMLDIGAGWGHTMKFFADHLVSAVGVDGDAGCAGEGQQCPGLLITHDYTLGPCSALGDWTFDLAWSAEFLEHVGEQFMPNYMADFKRCKYACVTHAEPGQHGHNHVNCKDGNYWIKAFSSNGFILDFADTSLLRKTDRWSAPWGRRTLLFFHRQ